MRLIAANFSHRFDGGTLYGYFSEAGLAALQFHDPAGPLPHRLHEAPNIVWGRALRLLLDQYFAGIPVRFDAVPLDLKRATSFQRDLWRAACAVPFGTVCTYADLARAAGRPRAARAAGSALGANPVCIVIPCHRIVAAGGGLGGYSGGLHWKRLLLALESRRPPPGDRRPPVVFPVPGIDLDPRFRKK